jgi:hypothetical protein
MLGADGGGDILALSKTHVVVSGTTRIAMRVPLDVTFKYRNSCRVQLLNFEKLSVRIIRATPRA